MNNTVKNADEALQGLEDGMMLALGGFGFVWNTRKQYCSFGQNRQEKSNLYFLTMPVLTISGLG